MTSDTVADALRLFIAPDQITELRAIHVGQRGRTFAGWYVGDQLRELARQALMFSRSAAGVYFVPNPVKHETAAKRLNRIIECHRGFSLTHDHDVIERRYIIVDLDPRRIRFDAAGKWLPDQDCPSNSRELGFARRIARRFVIPYLTTELNLEPPVEMLSGNGVHLVVRSDAEHDEAAFILQRLSDEFSCYGLTVDTNTHNLSRMLKVPGTAVRKGVATRDRPHRTARILTIPKSWAL